MTVFHLVLVPPPPPVIGQRIRTSAGSVTSSQSVTRTLTGLKITNAEGTVTAIKTGLGPMLGMQITSLQGGVSSTQALSRALTGSVITSAKGSISPQRQLAAQGKITSQKGTVRADRSLALLGRTITSSRGVLVGTSGVVIQTVSMTSAIVGSAYTFTFTATGGTGNFTWSFLAAPAWLTITNSATGVCGGTPPQLETDTVTVRCLDNNTLSFADKTFSLSVTSGRVWQTLKVGGGGFARGLIMHSDGTMVARTDTTGAYLYNGTSWVQLINPTSLPASYIATDPTTIGGGVYEVAIAPLNSSIMYMHFNNAMWSTANKGTTWTQLTSTAAGNPNLGGGAPGQMMAVDPHNSSIVFAGTDTGGLFGTVNAGTSWTVASGIATGATITGIVFDPASAVVGGATQGIYACRTGTGVYHSTDGGTTWTLTSGGPTSVTYAAISTTGLLYVVANAGANISTYNGTTWTVVNPTPGSINFQGIAINPFNQNEVVAVSQAGPVNISYNAGSTWTGSSTNMSLNTADIPWLLKANSFQGNPSPFFYIDSGGLQFSPITNGLLFQSGGTGMWQANIPASGATSNTAITWTDFSVGIENLIANEVVVPPGGPPVLAVWDRGPFFITTPNTYPSTYAAGMSDTINMSWSVDYASSSPSFVCALINYSSNKSGSTTDNGVTWTVFPAFPTGGTANGGNIAASTPSNILWAPSGNVAPSYTLNGGTTWTQVSIAGIASWTGWFAGTAPYRRICADRVNATTFYLYFPGNGVYISTNGGAAWTKQFTGNIDTHGNNTYQNPRILAVPTQAGHLFYTSGQINGNTASTVQPFYRSTNSGVTWTAVANVNCVACFGFGAPAPSQSYPSIHISGFVNGVLGMWQSDDNCVTWVKTGTYPGPQGLFAPVTMAADMNNYGFAYVGFGGYGHLGNGAGASYAYLPGS